MTNTINDLMFLFGFTPEKRIYNPYDQARIQAENDWFDGKDRDDNPYPKGKYGTREFGMWEAWDRHWLMINLNN